LEDALRSELLEDLLQRGHAHRVLTNIEIVFLVFNITKEETDRFIVASKLELKEIAALLDQFYLTERLGQSMRTL